MDNDEMRVYIDTLEKENSILKERNDHLYELNCNQARMISARLHDTLGSYTHMVQYDHFCGAKSVYNQVMNIGTSTTVMHTVNYI
jgi:hypothetical protein